MTTLIDKLINTVIPDAKEETKAKISTFVNDFIQNPDQTLRNNLIKIFLNDFSKKQGTDDSESFESIFLKKFNISPEQLSKMKEMGLDIFQIFNEKISQGASLNKAVDKSPFSYISIYAAIVLAVMKYGLGDRIKRMFNDSQDSKNVQLLIENLGDVQKEASKKEAVDYSKYLAELLRLFADGKGDGQSPSIIELLSNKEFQDYLLSTSANGLPNIINLTLPSINDLYSHFMQFKQDNEQAAKTHAPIENMGAIDMAITGVHCKVIKTYGALAEAQSRFKLDSEIMTRIDENNITQGGLVVYLATISEKDVLIVLSKQSEQFTGKKWLSYEVCTASGEEEPKAHYIASNLCSALNRR